jgi:hypothetical protein
MSTKIQAKDLVRNSEIVVEVDRLRVAGFKDGFNTIPTTDFAAKVITIIRSDSYTKNSRQIFYLDDKFETERAIVVPNEFLFTPADKETTQKLTEKFREYVLQNLWQHCRYLGSQIGSDPEIFVEANDKLIPAFDFLGSKEKPLLTGNGNNIYWDGFQGEFTTNANSCMQVHGDSIRSGLIGLYNAAKKHNKDAKLSIKTVFDIPLELLKTSKPEYVAFGCRASLNVYGLKGKEAPGEEVTYRSAGGHIHFGLGNLAGNKPAIEKMVKALDAVLGVACVSLFAKYDDPRRRQMYGLAGEYRLPPHGMEYRVLSNAWMFHPMIAHMVFDLARSTTTFGYKDFMKYWECDEKETIRIINECDVTAARAVLKKNKKILTQIINTRYANFDQSEFVFDIFYHGMESVIADPSNFVNNWNLHGTNTIFYTYVRDAMKASGKV